MRSRRSSRDSIPSTAAEDGDDSYKPSTTLAEECRFATAQQLNQTHGSAKKQPPLSSDNGVWSTPAAAAQIEDPSDTTDEPALVESETATRPLNSLLSKEKMEDTRNKRRPRLRSDWACSLGTLAVTLVSALMLWAIVKSYQERQCDANGCRMSRMSPVYLKTEGFDSEHTRFASKYSLYLYRENGVDEDYPVCTMAILSYRGSCECWTGYPVDFPPQHE